MHILQILNIILILGLIALLIYLIVELFNSNKEPKLYVPPEFEGEAYVVPEDQKMIAPQKIQIKTNDNFVGIINLKIKSLNSFKIDWGNGLQIPYKGTEFTQKLGPILYFSGTYTITIQGNVSELELNSTLPEISSILYYNFETEPKISCNSPLALIIPAQEGTGEISA